MSQESGAAATDATIERILVALDASPHSLRALKAAAELAALLQAELQGLFVEDINLVRISGFAFAREVGSYSAALRPLDPHAIEREFRVQAAKIRRAVAQTAVAANVRWTFRTTRGTVYHELMLASEAAQMLTVGRVGRSVGKRYGSTAHSLVQHARQPVCVLGEEGLVFPIVLYYNSSPAAERALQLALMLLHQRTEPLILLLPLLADESPSDYTLRAEGLSRRLQDRDVTSKVVRLEQDADLEEVLHTIGKAMLILPVAKADILDKVNRSAIVVP